MKKVAVFTYCEWNSYGSVLQAYGLNKALEKLDAKETIYKAFRMESPGNKKVRKGIKSRITHILSLKNRRKLNRIYSNNNDFIEKEFDIVYFDGFDELKNKIPENDIYLVGSDQIWNPTAIRKEMFLDFNTFGKKRISYAASFGVLRTDENRQNYIKEALETFDSLSVREKSMLPVLKDIDENLCAEVNIDPTFLVKQNEWNALSVEKKNIPNEYILVYALYWDKKHNEGLRNLSKNTGLPIVSIQQGPRPIFANKKIMDCDVREFLWLISNAKYVVTSSFHGLAFSIIFNKKFSAVINPASPSRLTDLLETFEIENCGVADIPEKFSANYEKVNAIIETEKKKSMEYLERNINE